jgi:DNA-binding CsgD family transcriptional regulator
MYMLSKRESQILGLVAVGLSPDEIGDRLYISRETVRKTVCNIKSKLSLGKATELAAYFWCKTFGASFDEQRRRIMASCMLVLFVSAMSHVDMFTRRVRARRTEVMIEINE